MINILTRKLDIDIMTSIILFIQNHHETDASLDTLKWVIETKAKYYPLLRVKDIRIKYLNKDEITVKYSFLFFSQNILSVDVKQILEMPNLKASIFVD